MNWEQICGTCQTEFKKLEAKLSPLKEFFPEAENAAIAFLNYEIETNDPVEVAVRQFAMSGEWPPLTPIQQVMLCFRLDFAASLASLLAQQPAPWSDTEYPDQREYRLCWLMLFAWENEGFANLHKNLQRLVSAVPESSR